MSVPGNTLGGIADLRGIVSVEWTIPDYFSLSHKVEIYYESPPFLLSRSTWCIRVYPNGQRLNHSVEWFGLYLRKIDTNINRVVTFTLGIKNPDCSVCKSCTTGYEFGAFAYGWSKFVARRTLLQLKPTIAPRGILTVFCVARLTSNAEVATQTTQVDGTDDLCADFRSLFLGGQKSDVIFRVNGTEIRAHKVILQARSPVFDAMFQHDWREKSNGVIDITDCDISIFREFLLFMYSGRIENLTLDNVTGLYSIADKYQLIELKERCAEFMKENLTMDTVCDIIAFADRYQEEELKKSAKDLLVRNMKDILLTEKWKLFMTQNSALAVELLMTVIQRNNSLS